MSFVDVVLLEILRVLGPFFVEVVSSAQLKCDFRVKLNIY